MTAFRLNVSLKERPVYIDKINSKFQIFTEVWSQQLNKSVTTVVHCLDLHSYHTTKTFGSMSVATNSVGNNKYSKILLAMKKLLLRSISHTLFRLLCWNRTKLDCCGSGSVYQWWRPQTQSKLLNTDFLCCSIYIFI